MNNQVVQAETAIKRIEALEGKKDDLIKKVEAFFKQRHEQNVRPVPKKFGTQLQNLTRLAESTTSVKEVNLFIRYQMGRENPDPRRRSNWKWRDGANNDGVTRAFGSELSSAIDEVAEIPTQETQVSESGVKPIDLVRLFLGYLQREAEWQEKLRLAAEAAEEESDEGGVESE